MDFYVFSADLSYAYCKISRLTSFSNSAFLEGVGGRRYSGILKKQAAVRFAFLTQHPIVIHLDYECIWDPV